MDSNPRHPERTRRALLASTARWLTASCLTAALAPFGCSRSEPACVDPNALTTGERSLRASQGYVDRSTTKAPDGSTRNCAGCQFFQGEAASPDCGRCQILGGSVGASDHCSAWAARKTA